MAAQRSASMAVLDAQLKAQHPGIVIGWIGDAAHAQTVSGHNPDDTPGVRAELSDADSLQEVRSLDPMIGPAFTRTEADQLVHELVSRRQNQTRLFYVIWYDRIWSRDGGWHSKPYQGADRHINHVHISGWAGDDNNTTPWAIGADMSVEEVVTGLRTPAQWRDATVEAAAIAHGDDITPSLRGIAEWILLATRYAEPATAEAIEALVAAVAGLSTRIEELHTAVSALTGPVVPVGLTPAQAAQAYRAAADTLDPQ